MMGGTCFTSFYSSFIQDLHSTGSPGVPLLKAEYTKKRRRLVKHALFTFGTLRRYYIKVMYHTKG